MMPTLEHMDYPRWTDGDSDDETRNRIEPRRYHRRFRGAKSGGDILVARSVPSMITSDKRPGIPLPSKNRPHWHHGENRVSGSDGPYDSSDDESSLSNSSTPTATVSYATLSALSTMRIPLTTPGATLPGSTDDADVFQPTTSSTRRYRPSLTPSIDTALVVAPATTFATSTISSTQISTAGSPIATASNDGSRAQSDSGLSPGVQKALIASGSIVGAILLISVAWLVWRCSKRPSSDTSRVWKSYGGISLRPKRALNGVAHKMPWTKSGTDDYGQADHGIIIPEQKKGSISIEEPQQPERVRINSYGIVFRSALSRRSILSLLAPSTRTSHRPSLPSLPPSPSHSPSLALSPSVSPTKWPRE